MSREQAVQRFAEAQRRARTPGSAVLAKFMEKRSILENPNYSLDDPGIMDALYMDAGSMPAIQPQRAVQTSAVYACVRILAESVATIPVHVYRKLDGRNVEKADDMPQYALLHDEPNEYQSSYTFREQLQAIASLWGNGYAEIQRNLRTGEVIAIHPLPAGQVHSELVRTKTSVKKVHRVGGTILDDADVLHIPALGWDGVSGISPIALHRATIGMTLSAEEFGANFYKNGTRLSGVLEHPSNLTKEAADRMRESWSAVYAGKANAGKVAVLEEGMKFNPLTMPLADAEYLATRKFQVNDIARIYNIPPHMIGDLEKATFSNIEQQSIDFVQRTLMPWLTRWEQELNRKLFSQSQKGKYFVKFNVAALMRGDIKSRYAAYAVGRQWGWLCADDIRESEDMNMIKGGDIYLTPLNMVPADQAKSQDPDGASDDTKDPGADE